MNETAIVGADDFNFLHGRWRVRHNRLRDRLSGCDDWQTFAGTCVAQPVLGGLGNIDDNEIHLPGGSYRAITVRTFDPGSAAWSIWWLDGRTPHALDPPVVGRFENGTGRFLASDVLRGRPIRIRFQWSDTDQTTPRWEQAFSSDNGASWETNWTMEFNRA
jgi:hypothetical protein